MDNGKEEEVRAQIKQAEHVKIQQLGSENKLFQFCWKKKPRVNKSVLDH